MTRFAYTVPKDHRAKRAAIVIYKDIEICKIVQCEDVYEGLYSYIFVPDHEAFAEARKVGLWDLPSIDDRTGEKQYNFIHTLPAFLYVRYIPLDRSDWYERYADVGLRGNQDQWEYMMRMGGRCHEDPFTLRYADIDPHTDSQGRSYP